MPKNTAFILLIAAFLSLLTLPARPRRVRGLLTAALLLWGALAGVLPVLVSASVPPPASGALIPKRVVSFYAGHTDNIVALGAGDRLVAVSGSGREEAVPLPPQVRFLPMKTGPEAVLALKPDAVIMRSLVVQVNPHLRAALERANVPVHVIDPPSWEDFGEYLARLAEILGTDPKAAADTLEKLRREIAQNAAAAQKSRNKKSPRVFLEATSRELHTCAPDSWAARLIELAGGVNAASDAAPLREGSPLAPWGAERLLEGASRGADGLDVYLVQQGPMNAATPDDVLARPWFGALGARLAAIPESCMSRPSLLGLERGGKMLLEIFYAPEE